MEANWFLNAIRSLVAILDSFIYSFISILYQILINLTRTSIFSEASINEFANRVYVFVGIIMIFKVTFSLVNYLVNPDAINDKVNGAGNVAKNIIITLVLIIIVPYAFSFLYRTQYAIINDNIIPKLILGNTSDSLSGMKIKLSDLCTDTGENSDGYVSIDNNGDYIALMTFRPFFQVSDAITSKGAPTPNEASIIEGYCEKTSVKNILVQDIYNSDDGNDTNNRIGNYIFDYSLFFSTGCGILVALMLISYTFDIAVRTIKLGFLEIFAPIPIISYVDPKSGKDGMFKKWLKEVWQTWLSLFVRLITLFFAIYIIKLVNDNSIQYEGKYKIWAMLFLIIGALIFAKQAPKLLEDIIGIKPSLQLNPFKKISDEALGGKVALGVGAAGAAATLGAVTNFGTRVGQGVNDVRQTQGLGNKLKAGAFGALRTVGSTIAGATASGYNAFQKTQKDGKAISGMWHGYQESNYSRFTRDENKRKAGVSGFMDEVIYAVESVGADSARLTGNLSHGQRMQINVQTDKKRLENRKEVSEKPLKNLKSYYEQIDAGLEKMDTVKAAQRELDSAKARGEEGRVIKEFEDKVKEAKKKEYANFMRTDEGQAISKGISQTQYYDSNNKLVQAVTPTNYDSYKQEAKLNKLEITRTEVIIRNEEERIRNFETSHDYQLAQAANKDQISRGQELKKGQDVSPNLGQITDNPYLAPLGGTGGTPPTGRPPAGPPPGGGAPRP